MRIAALFAPLALIVAGCSETPVEEKGEEAIAAHEEQIEADARTMEEVADEAVRAREADIDAELAADGVGVPVAAPAKDEN
ncbi:hypothetical protein [Parasphingorhabdus sp.]|uniref:hypothetical protein n=1 Tax=Parasphingorhabdus sp. TaxID=2709688 RepID=UPI003002CB4C